jgi:hypothetical protein
MVNLVNWLLTGPAGPKTVPSGVVERLPSGKLAGILTHFQTKVNTKFLLVLPTARILLYPYAFGKL